MDDTDGAISELLNMSPQDIFTSPDALEQIVKEAYATENWKYRFYNTEKPFVAAFQS